MNKSSFLILVLILIGALLHFYNLNWGAPFYFHPDERNIVDIVLKSSLSNPQSLFKGTFAYGNFPVILTLLLKPLFQPLLQLFNITDPFAQIVIILRIVSATFSVFTIYLIYLCGKFWSGKVGLLALFLATFSTGLIQQAHFGTYDGFVTFCAVTVFYSLLWFIKTKKFLFYYLSILLIALGTASKINFIILTIFPVSLLLKNERDKLLHLFKHTLLGFILLFSLVIVFSPNYLTQEFRNSLIYERGLVTGTTPVFYTQSFYKTAPISFQFLHVLPFLINPVLAIILIPAFFFVFYEGIKAKKQSFILLVSFFLILFIPQAFLFAKWTRYMVPTLPFIYLIISIAIIDFSNRLKKPFAIGHLPLAIFIFANILFSASYFITAFARPDTRMEAANFARNNIPQSAKIISEPYDLGLMAFRNPNITIVNFYDMDNSHTKYGNETLSTELKQANYIILPSQRIMRTRLLNKTKFPKDHSFYSNLINGDSGFKKIYETPCNIFCKITYLNNPVFGFEETASVFDRPTVFIYKRIR